MLRMIVVAAAAGALAIAGCGADDDDGDSAAPVAAAPTTTMAPAAAPQSDKPAREGTTIKVSSSDFGRILFDADDQAIYFFDKEQSSASECYGECAEAWPPVLTKGEPQAGSGTEASLLGTTKRDDGTTQVTYGGRPLYFYAHEGPGQVLCQNVSEFGGLWLVVQPNGEAVR